MLERLRQVAFMVHDLEEAGELYRRTLGMESIHTEDLSAHGLANLVLPAGNGTFVELLQPISAGSPGDRFLQRRGEAPYLLIFETKDLSSLVERLKALGVRITGDTEDSQHRSVFIHPFSANGAFLEFIQVSDPLNPWPAAGPDWPKKEGSQLTRRLRQVAVLVRDLDQAIERWGEMFDLVTTARFQTSFTDLEIAVMPLGGRDTFIELAQPTSSDTPSARFLERYGEGIYLTIYEIDDSLAMDEYLKKQGVRYTSSRETPNYTNLGFNSIWLHPSAMKGAFTQLSQVLDPNNPWPPAGEDWYL